MLFNRSAFVVRHAASRDETRYHINGVRFEADGTLVATDGHRLYRVETPAEMLDPADFPDCGDVTPTEDALEAFTLPLAAANAIVKAIPKNGTLPALRHARLDVAATNANGRARLVTTDLETVAPLEARKLEGDFPNYRQVMPEGEPVATVAFNAKYLADAAKAVVEFTGNPRAALKLELFGELSPARITATNADGQTFTAIVMPMRL